GPARPFPPHYQTRHERRGTLLLPRVARTTPRSALHRRFPGSYAANAVALWLDECGHVFISWSAETERIYRRVSDFQRLIRNRSRLHSRCYNRSSRHSHRFYASDAIAL